jgi:rhamnogalacturonyl hydrolase YesR
MRFLAALALAALSLMADDRLVIGLSQSKKPIEAIAIPGPTPDAPRVAIIGGWNGIASPAIARAAAHPRKANYSLTLIPLANPDASPLAFPPEGIAYRQNPESHYLWRWLDLHGIDLVVIAGEGGANLASALKSIPSIQVPESGADIRKSIPARIPLSEAHQELNRRIARTPREIAQELAKYYGHDLGQPVYIPAMALIGRLRLGEQADVERLAEPYVNGAKNSLDKPNATYYAGHLVFAELARRTHDPRYAARVQAAAELASTPAGDEMSDGVFMACPILAAAGYSDRALRHLRYMERLDLRPDGLYRHSPLNDAAWCRGNAFPALGMAWALEEKANPDILRSFQALIAALAKYQDRDGMWHEVIDQPGSYAEFSATAMIADAMRKGLRNKWLDPSYEAKVQLAWKGILARIGPEGKLTDVCEGTGKQKNADDYLYRAASNGKDARGGAMALLLSTDLLQ